MNDIIIYFMAVSIMSDMLEEDLETAKGLMDVMKNDFDGFCFW